MKEKICNIRQLRPMIDDVTFTAVSAQGYIYDGIVLTRLLIAKASLILKTFTGEYGYF